MRELHDFYGQGKGTRIARKACLLVSPGRNMPPDDQFRRSFNAIEDASEQLEALEEYFRKFFA